MAGIVPTEGNYHKKLWLQLLPGLPEPALNAALVNRYPREILVLTIKLSNEFMPSEEEQEQVLEDRLNRLGCGYCTVQCPKRILILPPAH